MTLTPAKRSYATYSDWKTLQQTGNDTLRLLETTQADNRAGAGDYEPLPWAVPVQDDFSFTLLLTGSAGGGKSRVAAQLIHRFMIENPGAAGLVMRKAREWASKSIVPFFKQTVIQSRAEYKKGDMWFEYPNGSLLYVGGMKDDGQRESVRSPGGDGGLDIVWFEEANAFTEQDFNEIIGRMRAKAGPYRQIILTTNPDSPNHWINQRLIIGAEASIYRSSAKDNPYNPPEYIDNLELLTGVQYERLVSGRWVQAEGAIFGNFSIEHNVTDDADYNPAWDVTWGVDDGNAYGQGPGHASYHPRVVLLGHMTPQGGVHIFDEYYKTDELGEQTIAHTLEKPYAKPSQVFVDSSALELKQRLYGTVSYVIPATHPVHEGIKNLRRLIGQNDGYGGRLLKIHPRCVNLIRELQSYRYDDHSKVANVGEPKPLKVDDHGPDALRYMTFHLRYEMT